MSTKVSGSGLYVLQEDIQGNLELEGDDITFQGNGLTVFGWVHVTGKRNKISDLNVAPRFLILTSKDHNKCQVCDKTGFAFDGKTSAIFVACNAEDLSIINVNLKSSMPLSHFAVVTSSEAIFKDCVFNGTVFNDPPTSKFVVRL